MNDALYSATTSDDSSSTRPTVSVLLIGNSQINSNDLPRLIATVAADSSKDVPRLDVNAAIVDGASLKKCWNAGEAEGSPRAMIAAKKWDYVLIQEIFCPDRGEFQTYAMKFDAEIKKTGATTVFFATANTTEYRLKSFTYPDSFLRLNGMQIEVGREQNIPVVAAGYAWMKYLGDNPSEAQRLDLYAEDRGHPGLKGSYIYACLLYAHLTGHNPELLPLPEKAWHYDDGMITKPELVRMRKAAWAQYQEDAARTSAP